MIRKILILLSLSIFSLQHAIGQVNPPDIVNIAGIFEDTSLLCDYNITWSKVQGEKVKYKVQCSADPTFSESNLFESSWLSQTYYTFTENTFDKMYYFRVKAQIGEDIGAGRARRIKFIESDWSKVKVATVSSILSIDIHKKSVWNFDTDVAWAKIPDETVFYKVECSTDSTFQKITSNSSWLNGTRFIFKDLKVNTKYYFRVISKIGEQEQTPSRRAYAFNPHFPPLNAGFVGDFWSRYFKPGGPIMYVLLLAVLFGLFLIYQLNLNTMYNKAFPNDMTQFITDANWKRNSKISELKILNSKLEQYTGNGIGRIVLAGFMSFMNNHGKSNVSAEMNRAIENTASVEKDKMEKWYLNTLWAVSSICPLLGLFGTVIGITLSFGEISKNLNAGIELSEAIPELAGGINLALLTTVWGLGIGIILFAAYYYFRARSDSIYSKWEQIVLEITKEF